MQQALPTGVPFSPHQDSKEQTEMALVEARCSLSAPPVTLHSLGQRLPFQHSGQSS